MAIHPSRNLPRVSRELALVLVHTSQINSHRGGDFDLSSTSTLLGLSVSGTDWGKWLSNYFTTHDIRIDAMMKSRNIDQEMLANVSGSDAEIGKRSWRMTEYMSYLFDEAYGFLSGGFRTNQLDERHLLAAYIYRSVGSHNSQLAEWGFDRVSWSNEFLAEIALRNSKEVKEWTKIHRETFKAEPNFPTELEDQLRSTTGQAPGPASQSQSPTQPRGANDQTQLLLDSPSTQDVLGRKYFAQTLAVRMNRAWDRYCESAAKGSFMLHIHGAWGSGKSSLLNLLRQELQPASSKRLKKPKPPPRDVDSEPPRDIDSVGWIVVDFNAWQRQRIEPPWWSLIDTVYTQARSQLKTVYDEPVHAWKLWLKERWWRVTTGRRDHLIAILLISSLLLGGIFYWRTWPPDSLWEQIKAGATLLGVVAGVWSTLLLVSRSLISGSSQSAQAFMQRSGDPMERVSKHFIDLLEWIDKPVVIFVDDLDRCQTTYVVTLLEGIQTLFNNPRVVYVITADRRWLYVCFEKIYEHFVEVVKEPGRQLGSLFLEKAFESSISMPRMSPERRKLYWDHLVMGTQPNVAEIQSATVRIAAEFKNDKTEGAVLGRLREGTGNPLLDEIRKGAAVRQLATQEVVKSTEYFLKPFAPLTEPNPRAMKRLVNGYTFLRDLAVLGGSELLFDLNTRNQLALWAIVSLRWPLLKEHLEAYLEEYPDEAPDVIEKICTKQTIPITASNLQELVQSREVIRVFNGEGIGTKLDKETICALVGISAAQPKSGGVA